VLFTPRPVSVKVSAFGNWDLIKSAYLFNLFTVTHKAFATSQTILGLVSNKGINVNGLDNAELASPYHPTVVAIPAHTQASHLGRSGDICNPAICQLISLPPYFSIS
jgi:hypothetical protein